MTATPPPTPADDITLCGGLAEPTSETPRWAAAGDPLRGAPAEPAVAGNPTQSATPAAGDSASNGHPLRGAPAEPAAAGNPTQSATPATGGPASNGHPLRGAPAEPAVAGNPTQSATPAAGGPASDGQSLRGASAGTPHEPAAGEPVISNPTQLVAPAAGGVALGGAGWPVEAGWVDAGLLAPVRAGVAVEAVVSDVAWLQAMLDAEAALARAQARLGAVPGWAAEVITAAARAERFDLRELSLAARETANPVVGLVQALSTAVARVNPAAAEYVHRGSTSQDVFDTGAMLVAARALELVRADLGRAAAALAALAAEHRDTAMPGRTLALQAVPTTFGLKAAGWRRLLLDAECRLAAVADGGLPVSLGGAAGTLAGYLEFARLDAPDGGGEVGGYVDRLVDAFAVETGLARPVLPWHSLRTPVADLSAALAFTAGALGKVAVDVQSLTRTEVGEVAEPTAVGRGASSAMPHKRNPVLATMIRAAALQVPALSAALTACLVHEDERSAGVWHAEWLLLRECLRLVGGAAQTAVELAEGLTVRPVRMLANLELTGGQMVSERVAAVLAPTYGRAEAKRLLGEASQEAEFNGIPLATVLVGRGLLPAGRAAELCDPFGYTGAAGALVDRALKQPPTER